MISRTVDRVVEEKCVIYACDICKLECGTEPNKYLRTCKMCGKEVCRTCRTTQYEGGSDYSTCYCNRCWEIGTPFREQYEALENKCAIEQNEVLDKWKELCKNDGCKN